MYLAQDDDMVQALAPDRSDNPFGKAILPARGCCNWFVPNAHCSQSACGDGAIDPIAITDHVTRSPIPRKCLGTALSATIMTLALTGHLTPLNVMIIVAIMGLVRPANTPAYSVSQ
jgi:hypothetical protein